MPWAIPSSASPYPFQPKAQQAFILQGQALKVWPSNVDAISANQVQFSDCYETPEGKVQTQWQVELDLTTKKITVQPIQIKRPGYSTFVNCPEIRVAFWKATLFTYDTFPTETQMPFAP